MKMVRQVPSESRIHFENEHLLIVHKAPLQLSVRSRFHKRKPESNVVDQFGKSLLPVHRLDREVEGLLLIAKNPHSQRLCAEYFAKRKVRKFYWALSTQVSLTHREQLPFTADSTTPKTGACFEWKSKILRGKRRSYECPSGDPSLTFARLVAVHSWAAKKIYCWELEPRTGRSHQLRFEMAKHGHPVLGDALYFAPDDLLYPKGIALVAKELDFSDCPERLALSLPQKVGLEFSWEDFLSRLAPSGSIQAGDRESQSGSR